MATWLAFAQIATDEVTNAQNPAPSPGPSSTRFVVCKNQTYALCAAAQCRVFDGVNYCPCDVLLGDSISFAFHLSNGEDVCSVNAAGVGNGYMVSTYSVPESVLAPNGNRAVYTCLGDSSDGAYAQCDGGLCFTSTEETTFPGFEGPLSKGQIICSCPIVMASPGKPNLGYQIIGPFPCEESFFQYCNSSTANKSTGATMYVGAPPGLGQALAIALYGSLPALNTCR